MDKFTNRIRPSAAWYAEFSKAKGPAEQKELLDRLILSHVSVLEDKSSDFPDTPIQEIKPPVRDLGASIPSKTEQQEKIKPALAEKSPSPVEVKEKAFITSSDDELQKKIKSSKETGLIQNIQKILSILEANKPKPGHTGRVMSSPDEVQYQQLIKSAQIKIKPYMDLAICKSIMNLLKGMYFPAKAISDKAGPKLKEFLNQLVSDEKIMHIINAGPGVVDKKETIKLAPAEEVPSSALTIVESQPAVKSSVLLKKEKTPSEALLTFFESAASITKDGDFLKFKWEKSVASTTPEDSSEKKLAMPSSLMGSSELIVDDELKDALEEGKTIGISKQSEKDLDLKIKEFKKMMGSQDFSVENAFLFLKNNGEKLFFLLTRDGEFEKKILNIMKRKKNIELHQKILIDSFEYDKLTPTFIFLMYIAAQIDKINSLGKYPASHKKSRIIHLLLCKKDKKPIYKWISNPDFEINTNIFSNLWIKTCDYLFSKSKILLAESSYKEIMQTLQGKIKIEHDKILEEEKNKASRKAIKKSIEEEKKSLKIESKEQKIAGLAYKLSGMLTNVEISKKEDLLKIAEHFINEIQVCFSAYKIPEEKSQALRKEFAEISKIGIKKYLKNDKKRELLTSYLIGFMYEINPERNEDIKRKEALILLPPSELANIVFAISLLEKYLSDGLCEENFLLLADVIFNIGILNKENKLLENFSVFYNFKKSEILKLLEGYDDAKALLNFSKKLKKYKESEKNPHESCSDALREILRCINGLICFESEDFLKRLITVLKSLNRKKYYFLNESLENSYHVFAEHVENVPYIKLIEDKFFILLHNAISASIKNVKKSFSIQSGFYQETWKRVYDETMRNLTNRLKKEDDFSVKKRHDGPAIEEEEVLFSETETILTKTDAAGSGISFEEKEVLPVDSKPVVVVPSEKKQPFEKKEKREEVPPVAQAASPHFKRAADTQRTRGKHKGKRRHHQQPATSSAPPVSPAATPAFEAFRLAKKPDVPSMEFGSTKILKRESKTVEEAHAPAASGTAVDEAKQAKPAKKPDEKSQDFTVKKILKRETTGSVEPKPQDAAPAVKPVDGRKKPRRHDFLNKAMSQLSAFPVPGGSAASAWSGKSSFGKPDAPHDDLENHKKIIWENFKVLRQKLTEKKLEEKNTDEKSFSEMNKAMFREVSQARVAIIESMAPDFIKLFTVLDKDLDRADALKDNMDLFFDCPEMMKLFISIAYTFEVPHMAVNSLADACKRLIELDKLEFSLHFLQYLVESGKLPKKTETVRSLQNFSLAIRQKLLSFFHLDFFVLKKIYYINMQLLFASLNFETHEKYMDYFHDLNVGMSYQLAFDFSLALLKIKDDLFERVEWDWFKTVLVDIVRLPVLMNSAAHFNYYEKELYYAETNLLHASVKQAEPTWLEKKYPSPDSLAIRDNDPKDQIKKIYNFIDFIESCLNDTDKNVMKLCNLESMHAVLYFYFHVAYNLYLKNQVKILLINKIKKIEKKLFICILVNGAEYEQATVFKRYENKLPAYSNLIKDCFENCVLSPGIKEKLQSVLYNKKFFMPQYIAIETHSHRQLQVQQYYFLQTSIMKLQFFPKSDNWKKPLGDIISDPAFGYMAKEFPDLVAPLQKLYLELGEIKKEEIKELHEEEAKEILQDIHASIKASYNLSEEGKKIMGGGRDAKEKEELLYFNMRDCMEKLYVQFEQYPEICGSYNFYADEERTYFISEEDIQFMYNCFTFDKADIKDPAQIFNLLTTIREVIMPGRLGTPFKDNILLVEFVLLNYILKHKKEDATMTLEKVLPGIQKWLKNISVLSSGQRIKHMQSVDCDILYKYLMSADKKSISSSRFLSETYHHICLRLLICILDKRGSLGEVYRNALKKIIKTLPSTYSILRSHANSIMAKPVGEKSSGKKDPAEKKLLSEATEHAAQLVYWQAKKSAFVEIKDTSSLPLYKTRSATPRLEEKSELKPSPDFGGCRS